MKRFLLHGLLLTLALLAAPAASAQDPAPPGVPSLYLDCRGCDETFVRREIDFVNYVRERQPADVHVLVTDEETGSGGRTFVVELIGQRAFQGQVQRVSFTTASDATSDDERTAFVRSLRAGLVPFLLQTPLASRIDVVVEGAAAQTETPAEDPWDGWTFELYGDGFADLESSRTALRVRYGVYADRVTETWKVRVRPYFNYERQRFESAEATVVTTSRRDGLESFVIRSLTDHWSAGVFGDVITTTFGNIDLRVGVSPGVEYSVFPYREASRRQLTAVYRVGLAHVQYADTTIFGEIEEVLASQALEVDYRLRQPWGSVDVGLEGSHYVHDLSKYRIAFDGRVSLRLVRGLSLSGGAEVDLVHDQLNLPKGDASFEEVLLRQRQLATTFEVSASIGFRYRFGSLYNNVVNTRF